MDIDFLKRLLLKGDNIFFTSSRSKKTIEIINMKLKDIFSQEKCQKYILLVKYFSIKNKISDVEDILFKREVLKEFLVCDNIDYQYNFKEFVVFYNNDLISLNDEDLECIFNILQEMYQISIKEDEEITGSPEAVAAYKELMEFEAQCKKKKAITLESIIEAVSSKHPSYNLFNIWDLTIYQLFRTYKRIELIDMCSEINHWSYSGFIDIKKLNKDEIHWARNI